MIDLTPSDRRPAERSEAREPWIVIAAMLSGAGVFLSALLVAWVLQAG